MSLESLIKNGHIIIQAKCYLIAALCIFFAGCSQGGKNPGQDEIDFGLKLTPGKTHVMRLLEEDYFSSGTQPKQTDLSHIKTTELGFDVETVNEKDVASIKVTLRAMKEKTTNPRGSYEYDYTDPSVVKKTPLARVYHSMMGESFLIKVAPSGKLVSIDANEMFTQTADKILAIENKRRSSAEQNAEERAARLKEITEGIKSYSNTSEEYLRYLTGNIIPSFPTRTMRAGNSWTDKIEISQLTPLPIEAEGTYTLKKGRQRDIVIEADSQYVITDKPIPQSGRQATYSGNVTVKGDFEIDKATGWLIHKEVKLRLDGEMKDRGKMRPISMESTIAVESVE